MEAEKYLSPNYSIAFGRLGSKIKEKYSNEIDSMSSSSRMTFILNADKAASMDRKGISDPISSVTPQGLMPESVIARQAYCSSMKNS